jgi:cytochrome c
MKPGLVPSALMLLLCAGAASAQSFRPWSPVVAARAAGKQIYMEHCSVCHAWNADVPVAQGPSLVGIVGRPAASQPGFPYSEALKKSGIVWTEDNLKKWLADNAHMVPGTLMPHVSISDPAEQVYVVEYLKTLKASNSGR